LAWIDAYDLTQAPDYLNTAEIIFADMTTQWDTTTCGAGVWWSKDLKHSAYKNAITNEIFLDVAASLVNRVADAPKKVEYRRRAQKEWAWFNASGMIDAQNLVNDGLNATNPSACTNNHQTTWTYNQGVVLGGLAELYKFDHDAALLSKAQSFAEATMTTLVTKTGSSPSPRRRTASAAMQRYLPDKSRASESSGATWAVQELRRDQCQQYLDERSRAKP